MTQFEGHTPGPWYMRSVYIPYDDSDIPCSWIVTDKGEWNELDAENDKFKLDLQIDTCEEDARLIAAAPDLLAERDRYREALKECEVEIDNYIYALYPGESKRKTRELKLNPARLALKGDNDET